MWLTNLQIILPNQEIESGAIHIQGATIAAIIAGDCPHYAGEPIVDCAGLLALPGLIDIYGDLLERELEPRPGSLFPLDAALHEFDKRIVGAGITLSYAALTLDTPEAHWRSRRPEHVQAVAAMLAEERPEPLAAIRAHLRISADAHDATAAALALIAADQVALISLRGLCPESHIIAESAASYAIPLALHDPADATEIARAHALGIQLCLLPRTLALTYSAKACGMQVAASAPDLLRGQGYPAGAAVHAALREGLVDLLVSDESPIALLQACFSLARDHTLSLAQAVALASIQPAKQLGMQKRGMLAVGSTADLILVEAGIRARVRATIRAGEFVYRRGELSAMRVEAEYVAY